MNSWVCARIGTDRGQPADLVGRIDDDPPYSGFDRTLELSSGLVVAVDRDPLGGKSSGECDRQFASGTHVQADALLSDPLRNRRAQERLGCIEHVHTGRAVRAGA
jgi:hypothetical protein